MPLRAGSKKANSHTGRSTEYLHSYVLQAQLQHLRLQFQHEVEGSRHAKSKGIDQHHCLTDELQLEEVFVPDLSRAEFGEQVVGEIAHEA